METVESLLKKAENCLVLNNKGKALEYYNLVLEEDISNAEAWYWKAKLDYILSIRKDELELELFSLEKGFEYINTDNDYLENIRQKIEQCESAIFDVAHTLGFLENYLKNTNSLHHDIADIIKEIFENYCFQQKSLINIDKRGEQIIPNKEFKVF